MFLGWRLIRVAMTVWPAMIFLETTGPFSRSCIAFLTRSEFEALQTKYLETRALRTLQLPLVSESEVQTEEVSRFDVEVQTEIQSAID